MYLIRCSIGRNSWLRIWTWLKIDREMMTLDVSGHNRVLISFDLRRKMFKRVLTYDWEVFSLS